MCLSEFWDTFGLFIKFKLWCDWMVYWCVTWGMKWCESVIKT